MLIARTDVVVRPYGTNITRSAPKSKNAVRHTSRSRVGFFYKQNRCLPIVSICGRDQIHAEVAVAGLK
jgi:hypothetical protein